MEAFVAQERESGRSVGQHDPLVVPLTKPTGAPRKRKNGAPSSPRGAEAAAGRSYSTVGDLLRYVLAQRTGAIAGTSGKPAGWAGGSPGANTFLVPDLLGENTLIALANVDPPIAERIQGVVRRWLAMKSRLKCIDGRDRGSVVGGWS